MPCISKVVLIFGIGVADLIRAEVIKGISYGPIPLKSQIGASEVPEDDWFCDEAVPMWGNAGRADLAIMQKLGANLVRLYGNNPANDHTNFLDEALARGLSVAPGMSDYPFYQQKPGSCIETDFNCFTQVKPLYLQNLRHGFLDTTNKYHRALKYMNIINEPDLKIPSDADGGSLEQVKRMCRAIISAFDGMLEAEEEAGVTGPLINFTATFSYAICQSCEFAVRKPALSQMAQLDDAMRYPDKYDYTPKNDITNAYLTRFTHSFNTQNPAHDVKVQFLDRYAEEFPSTPVYIAEYHRVGANQTQDLGLILDIAESSNLFLGISFFQYQVAYSKAGTEREFGMFGLGDQVVASMPYFSKTYDIFCLQPEDSPSTGSSLSTAMALVYGGEGINFTTLCGVNPEGVDLDQAGYLRVASQDSIPKMSSFVQRVIRHMGASVKTGHYADLANLAEHYSANVANDSFALLASYIGGQPDWLVFDPEARCVANRNAPPGIIGAAINWVCTHNASICNDIPSPCDASTYRKGDFIFGRFAKESEGSWDPLSKCDFEGAALYAPSELYSQWTGVDECEMTTTTQTMTTSTITTTSTTTADEAEISTTKTKTTTAKSQHFMSSAHGLFPQVRRLVALLGFLGYCMM